VDEQDGFAANMPEQHPTFRDVLQRDALAKVTAVRL
jgi:hypothetical protein